MQMRQRSFEAVGIVVTVAVLGGVLNPEYVAAKPEAFVMLFVGLSVGLFAGSMMVNDHLSSINLKEVK